MMESLDDIRRKIEEMAVLINAPEGLFPSFNGANVNRFSYIETGKFIYHNVGTDGGREVKRTTVSSLDELLYLVFEGITFEMAVSYGKDHIVMGEDFRRVFFRRQLELLDRLNSHWKEQRASEIESILKFHPYIDK